MILLTGSEGYIGTRIHPADDQIISCDLQGSPDLKMCFSELENVPNLASRITHVIHLAEFKFQELTRERVRVSLLRNRRFFDFLKTCRNLQKVILASSCSVYGHTENLVSEKSPLHLTSYYAEAKANMEALASEAQLPVLALRFATAYGHGRVVREDLFINKLIASLMRKEPFEIIGLNEWRPYLHNSDFARALVFFKDKADEGIINISEANYTKQMILDLLQFDRLNSSTISFGARGLSEPRNYRVQTEKMAAAGFEPKVRLRNYLKEILGGSDVMECPR